MNRSSAKLYATYQQLGRLSHFYSPEQRVSHEFSYFTHKMGDVLKHVYRYRCPVFWKVPVAKSTWRFGFTTTMPSWVEMPSLEGNKDSVTPMTILPDCFNVSLDLSAMRFLGRRSLLFARQLLPSTAKVHWIYRDKADASLTTCLADLTGNAFKCRGKVFQESIAASARNRAPWMSPTRLMHLSVEAKYGLQT